MNLSWAVFVKSGEPGKSDLRLHHDVILPVFVRRQDCSPAQSSGPSEPAGTLPAPSPASSLGVPLDSSPHSEPSHDQSLTRRGPLAPFDLRPRSPLTDFIESSLLYQVFRGDFPSILEFCLNPDARPPGAYQGAVHPLSHLLIQMIHKCRVNKLKTEQKIKKVINHAYDLMKRRYLADRYKNLGHISDAHKREVFVYYFNRDGQHPEDFIRRMAEAPLWRSADKFNLAYNKRFFSYVRECPRFIADLGTTIDQLESLAVDTIKNDLRLFMKDVVRYAYQNSSQPINSFLPGESAIVEFFDIKVQKELNKKGIKFPWTEAQYKSSIEVLRSYVRVGPIGGDETATEGTGDREASEGGEAGRAPEETSASPVDRYEGTNTAEQFD